MKPWNPYLVLNVSRNFSWNSVEYREIKNSGSSLNWSMFCMWKPDLLCCWKAFSSLHCFLHISQKYLCFPRDIILNIILRWSMINLFSGPLTRSLGAPLTILRPGQIMKVTGRPPRLSCTRVSWSLRKGQWMRACRRRLESVMRRSKMSSPRSILRLLGWRRWSVRNWGVSWHPVRDSKICRRALTSKWYKYNVRWVS